MAITISKEDFTGVLSTGSSLSTVTPSLQPVDALSKINSVLQQIDILLKNPLIQQVIMRYAGRFGLINSPPPITSNPISTNTQNPATELNPENVYTMILSTINSIMTVAGDLPLSKVKEYLISNKDAVMQSISGALKPKGVENANNPSI